MPPIHALVVDDYQDAAESLARLLEMLGCTAKFVTDSTIAMQAAASKQPRIAFIDLGMPTLNGFELAALLRTRYGDGIQLVAVTAYGGRGVQAKCDQAGFDGRIQKPVDPAAIERTIQSLS